MSVFFAYLLIHQSHMAPSTVFDTIKQRMLELPLAINNVGQAWSAVSIIIRYHQEDFGPLRAALFYFSSPDSSEKSFSIFPC